MTDWIPLPGLPEGDDAGLSPVATDRGRDGGDRMRGWAVPHEKTFAAIWQSGSKSYWFRHDEALRKSYTDALAMRRDPVIHACLRRRQYPTSAIPFAVEPEDPSAPHQRIAARVVSRLIERIPRFQQMKIALLESIFYGRAGAQLKFGPMKVDGFDLIGIRDHHPIEGDKIVRRWGGTPGVLVNASWASSKPSEGGPKPWMRKHISLSGHFGYALWLETRELKDRYLIHTFEPTDTDYLYEGELAGAIYGLGLRSRLWYSWNLRNEIASWALDALQRIGANGMLYGRFQNGNDEERELVLEMLAKLSKDHISAFPRRDSQSGADSPVETIPVNPVGYDILATFQNMYEGQIREIINGDSPTAVPSADTRKAAELTEDARMSQLRADAAGLQETLTTGIANPLLRLNRKEIEAITGAPVDYRLRVKLQIDRPNAVEDMQAANMLIGVLATMGATDFPLDPAYLIDLAGLRPPEGGTITQEIKRVQAEAAGEVMPPPEPGMIPMNQQPPQEGPPGGAPGEEPPPDDGGGGGSPMPPGMGPNMPRAEAPIDGTPPDLLQNAARPASNQGGDPSRYASSRTRERYERTASGGLGLPILPPRPREILDAPTPSSGGAAPKGTSLGQYQDDDQIERPGPAPSAIADNPMPAQAQPQPLKQTRGQRRIAKADAEIGRQKQKARGLKEYQDQGTDAPKFQQWFEGSKVVDESGQPKDVYHGSVNRTFTKFDGNRDAGGNLYGKGIYFTESPDVANRYATVVRNPQGERTSYPGSFSPSQIDELAQVARSVHGNSSWADEADADARARPGEFLESIAHTDEAKDFIDRHAIQAKRVPADRPGMHRARMKIKNPLDVDQDEIDGDAINEQMVIEAFGGDARRASRFLAGVRGRKLNYHQALTLSRAALSGRAVTGDEIPHAKPYGGSATAKDALNSIVRSLGHDGLTHMDGREDGQGDNPHRVWIAFEPNQVKSKANFGTFDPESDHLHHSSDLPLERYALDPSATPDAPVASLKPKAPQRAAPGTVDPQAKRPRKPRPLKPAIPPPKQAAQSPGRKGQGAVASPGGSQDTPLSQNEIDDMPGIFGDDDGPTDPEPDDQLGVQIPWDGPDPTGKNWGQPPDDIDDDEIILTDPIEGSDPEGQWDIHGDPNTGLTGAIPKGVYQEAKSLHSQDSISAYSFLKNNGFSGDEAAKLIMEFDEADKQSQIAEKLKEEKDAREADRRRNPQPNQLVAEPLARQRVPAEPRSEPQIIKSARRQNQWHLDAGYPVAHAHEVGGDLDSVLKAVDPGTYLSFGEFSGGKFHWGDVDADSLAERLAFSYAGIPGIEPDSEAFRSIAAEARNEIKSAASSDAWPEHQKRSFIVGAIDRIAKQFAPSHAEAAADVTRSLSDQIQGIIQKAAGVPSAGDRSSALRNATRYTKENGAGYEKYERRALEMLQPIVKEYASGATGAINGLMRGMFDPGKSPYPKGHVARIAKDLQRVASNGRTDRNLVMFRGLTMNDEELGLLAEGSVIHDPAFQSTSLTVATPMQFLAEANPDRPHPALIRIRAPKGSRGIFVNYLDPDNIYDDEAEFLMPADTSHVVRSMSKIKTRVDSYAPEMELVVLDVNIVSTDKDRSRYARDDMEPRKEPTKDDHAARGAEKFVGRHFTITPPKKGSPPDPTAERNNHRLRKRRRRKS